MPVLPPTLKYSLKVAGPAYNTGCWALLKGPTEQDHSWHSWDPSCNIPVWSSLLPLYPCLLSASASCPWSYPLSTSNPEPPHPFVHLVDDEPAGHAEARLGSEAVGDHDTQAGFWEAVVWGTGVHDLIHHHHRASAVSFAGFHCGRIGTCQGEALRR